MGLNPFSDLRDFLKIQKIPAELLFSQKKDRHIQLKFFGEDATVQLKHLYDALKKLNMECTIEGNILKIEAIFLNKIALRENAKSDFRNKLEAALAPPNLESLDETTKPQQLPISEQSATNYNLKKFEPYGYIWPEKDNSIISGENTASTTTQLGREIIADYYREKYSANITLPKYSEGNFAGEYIERSAFFNQFEKQLEKIRATSTEGDYREALVFSVGSHATPIIYLRENGRDAFLYADSISPNNSVCAEIARYLPVYVVEEKRQADYISCYTDAMVISRDATGRDPETKQYIIPNLLSFLEENSNQTNNYRKAILPQPLLKTAQIGKFRKTHKDSDKTNGYPKDFIDSFFDRYKQTATVRVRKNTSEVPEFETKTISSYVRIKGLKLSEIVECQFYLEQMEKKIGRKLTTDERKGFIEQSKIILRSKEIDDDNKRENIYQLASAELQRMITQDVNNAKGDITQMATDLESENYLTHRK